MNSRKSITANLLRFFKSNIEFVILLILATALSFIFVFKGFVTGDMIRYALGTRNIIENGIAHTCYGFDSEIGFGYYVILYLLNSLLSGYMSLSSIMNYLSAFASIILICNLFYLFKSLSSNKILSFFASLLFLLSPGIWFISHYGNPNILALTFFISSLNIVDSIINKPSNNRICLLWIVFFLLSVITLTIRLDTVLGYASVFGLLYYRKSFSLINVIKVAIVLLFSVVTTLFFRLLIVGYFFSPGGGTVANHLLTRIEPALLLKNIFINFAFWSISLNIFVCAIALIGLTDVRISKRLKVLFLSMTIPWFIFLPFRAMDIGRIVAPTFPIIIFMAAFYIGFLFKRYKFAVLALLVLISQMVSILLYYPVTKSFNFKISVDGRILGTLPLGFLPTDNFTRQQFISKQDEIAKKISQTSDAPVLIVGGSGNSLTYYVYYLYNNRNILSYSDTTINEVFIEEYSTPQNNFYFLELNKNRLINDPINRTFNYFNDREIKIHFVPYWTEYPTSGKKLFIDGETVQQILNREPSVMQVRNNY